MKIKITESQLSYLKENIDDNRILYIGLELDEESKNVLYRFGKNVIGKFWNPTEAKMICHHMTIVFKTQLNDEILNWAKSNEGREYMIEAYSLGVSNKAVAVKVNTDCPSMNSLKHITVAVNQRNGGKPVDSNYITDWNRINPIRLKGNVTIYYKR